ncbi:MAG: sodium:alanine symporter family protein [Nitrospinae bacterium]|nr:sodium:alanine symporter family protein [Nitrospinota bacterium]
MDFLASLLWNPILSIVYLELGVIVLFLTGAVAWRKSFGVFRTVWTKEKNEDKKHQISHVNAFMATLAASIGVGNLAGVGTAIHLGGPGALFWMWVSALFGMSFRMCATYLAVKHGPDDHLSPSFATPMAYLEKFLSGKWKWVPIAVAGLILTKGFVTANLIQSNSVAHALHHEYDIPNIVVALFLTVAVAFVILGGLMSIVRYSTKIAPLMILIYITTGLMILVSDPARTVDLLGSVFYYAFNPWAFAGGVAGYTVLEAMQFGVSRGVFSHGSGIGVSPFLHGANKDHPATGAYMAALTPVVDTLIVCTITGLVILSSGYWKDLTGAFLTVQSYEIHMGKTGGFFVILCLGLFAFTTIINWAYFAEKCFRYIGGKNIVVFRYIFLITTFCGPFFTIPFIWSLGDVLIGLLIIFHLFPLLYVLLIKVKSVREDLTVHPKS